MSYVPIVVSPKPTCVDTLLASSESTARDLCTGSLDTTEHYNKDAPGSSFLFASWSGNRGRYARWSPAEVDLIEVGAVVVSVRVPGHHGLREEG